MLDRLSIPRRPLDFEDYVDIVRRNIRWLIGPAFAGLVISTVTAYVMEDTYVSQAMIRIVPQQIAEDMVKNVSSQDVSDRINGMAQEILSRGTLSSIIDSEGLYKSELKHEPRQDVLNLMREAIIIKPTINVTNVEGTKISPAMQVQFSYRDPMMANKVCADLVSRFMNASSAESLDSQVSTNQFLKDEYDRAKQELDTANQHLADYRIRNAGRLPEEAQTNITQMTALEQRMGALSDASTRNAERRMVLDADLRIAKDRLDALKNAISPSSGKADRVIELDKQITDLESTIASMKDRYTDSYPDLQAARDQLAVLKKERDDASKSSGKADNAPESPLLARERREAQESVQAMQTQIKAAELEELQVNRDLQAVNAELRTYQSRIETAPAGEKEYSDLQRDAQLARQKFEQLDINMHRSNLSMDLERRKEGETLELLDAASMPTEPTEPKRALIIPIGLVAGLALGVVLVALREVRDTSLKNLKDARLYTQLAILGSIPLLENDVVVQRRKQVMWVGWATATIFGLAIIAGAVIHYHLGKA